MAGLGWIRYLGQRTQSPSPRPALVDDDLAGELRHSPSSSPKQLHPQDRVHLTSNILNLDVRTSSTRDLDGGVDAVPSPLPTGENTPAVSIKDSGGGTLDDKTATTYEHDRTWHAPSLDQIVEALKVAMMTKWDSLAPIPVQYNSHVLHLLEGYAKQQRCLADAAEKAADAQSRWDKEREEVRILAKMWSSREEDYRQEVRRLGLLLAGASPDGTGAVILARAGSLVDRGARKEFQERLARLGDPQDRRGSLMTGAELSWTTQWFRMGRMVPGLTQLQMTVIRKVQSSHRLRISRSLGRGVRLELLVSHLRCPLRDLVDISAQTPCHEAWIRIKMLN